MNHRQQSASEFAHFIKGLGFRAFLADSGDYGFITDATGSRVMSFSFTGGSSLSGNYGPPSRTSGTGWQLSVDTYHLKSADDVKRALYAEPPSFCQRARYGEPDSGWQYFTTLDQHLAAYGSSSKYREI